MKKNIEGKMTKAKSEIVDNLFELFAGEYVSILIEMTVENMTQTEKEVEIVKAPLTVTGYLSDVDDVYLYLGFKPNIFNQAVRKDKIIHLEAIEEPKEEKENVFKDVKGPDGRGYN
jgi:hypothetical protein